MRRGRGVGCSPFPLQVEKEVASAVRAWKTSSWLSQGRGRGRLDYSESSLGFAFSSWPDWGAKGAQFKSTAAPPRQAQTSAAQEALPSWSRQVHPPGAAQALKSWALWYRQLTPSRDSLPRSPPAGPALKELTDSTRLRDG